MKLIAAFLVLAGAAARGDVADWGRSLSTTSRRVGFGAVDKSATGGAELTWLEPGRALDCTPSVSSGCEVDCIDQSPSPQARTTLLLEDLPFDSDPVKITRVFTIDIGVGERSPGLKYPSGAMVCVETGELTIVQAGEDKSSGVRGDCLRVLPNEPFVFVNSGSEEIRSYVYLITYDATEGGEEYCEDPPKAGPDAWTKGLVPCLDCEDIYERQCTIMGTCGPDYQGTENYEQACLDDCMINGEPSPTSTWFVESVPLGDAGLSVNDGKIISMEPSWSVQGGFSGVMLPDFDIEDGLVYDVEHTTRLKGTRSVTHTHDYAGVTCVYQGEMTLLLDLLPVPAITAKAGECYWMPARRFMSGMNTGNINTLMWDLFVVEKDVAALNPKESFVQSPETRLNSQVYCDNNKPFVDSTLNDCCVGTAVQDQTSADVLGWICPGEECEYFKEEYGCDCAMAKNHGDYASCVNSALQDRSTYFTKMERNQCSREAKKSDCGRSGGKGKLLRE